MGDGSYIRVLNALQDLPFNVGRKLLIDYLRGNKSNESIQRNHLHTHNSFGSLAYDDQELNGLIDYLIFNNLIELVSINGKKFWKGFELTAKGRRELQHPTLHQKKVAAFTVQQTIITEKDKELFSHFPELAPYNDEQKKAIISANSKILCIAGAGSGKTTVLTKRIEFLVKYRSVDPQRILAITFTRKARAEMISRVHVPNVQIETFNSFCEKILRRHNDLVYERPVEVITYKHKIKIINKALQSIGIEISQAIDTYFTTAQQRGKTPEQLAHTFMNDCFFIRDYFKFKHRQYDSQSITSPGAKLVFNVCNYIDSYMQRHGLRDFADQMLDAMALFQSHPDLIPKFDHILIDEYQDVNSTQIEFVNMLNAPNVFCVGDPRQSIFGWRGSDIKYILNFEERYPTCEIISLTKNYRSTKAILDLCNKLIKRMGFANLEQTKEGTKDIKLFHFSSEEAEFNFVIEKILNSDVKRSEIFVLARTNRQLQDLSEPLKAKKIAHVVRSDEIKKTVVAQEHQVTLATIHAIKGLEAQMVFVIGCNNANFPCKGSEHPITEFVDEYDKEEEERRLFYVAMSRAKQSLYLSYTGSKPTYFITDEMLELMEQKSIQETFKPNGKLNSSDIINRLKTWRSNLSRELGVPPFMIMHDKSLIEIAQTNPMTTAELEKIYGLGPTKIMKYGKEILSVVNGY